MSERSVFGRSGNQPSLASGYMLLTMGACTFILVGHGVGMFVVSYSANPSG